MTALEMPQPKHSKSKRNLEGHSSIPVSLNVEAGNSQSMNGKSKSNANQVYIIIFFTIVELKKEDKEFETLIFF